MAEFFKVPGTIGVTPAERRKFLAYLELVGEHGLDLLRRQSNVLEKRRDHVRGITAARRRRDLVIADPKTHLSR